MRGEGAFWQTVAFRLMVAVTEHWAWVRMLDPARRIPVKSKYPTATTAHDIELLLLLSGGSEVLPIQVRTKLGSVNQNLQMPVRSFFKTFLGIFTLALTAFSLLNCNAKPARYPQGWMVQLLASLHPSKSNHIHDCPYIERCAGVQEIPYNAGWASLSAIENHPLGGIVFFNYDKTTTKR